MMMRKLCKGLRQCRLNNDDQKALAIIFKSKLGQAVQKNTGHKARYRLVEFETDDEKDIRKREKRT